MTEPTPMTPADIEKAVTLAQTIVDYCKEYMPDALDRGDLPKLAKAVIALHDRLERHVQLCNAECPLWEKMQEMAEGWSVLAKTTPSKLRALTLKEHANAVLEALGEAVES